MPLRDIVLFMILAASVPVILRSAWIGILMWYWIGLMNPHRLTWGFMSDFQAALLVAATTLIALAFTKEREMPRLNREVVLLLLMALWFTVTSAFAWIPDAAWGYWEQVMKTFLFTVLTPVLISGKYRTQWLMIVVAGSLAFYGVKGGIFTLLTGGQHPVLGPARSFIDGNTTVGLAMLMTMPLILVLARQMRSGRLSCIGTQPWVRLGGWFGYAAFWLTGLATVFTYSRGALLGLAAIAPFIFLKMRYKVVLAGLAIFGFSSVLVLVPDQLIERANTIANYTEDWSAMQRIQAWGVNFNIAVDNPLGAGFLLEHAHPERWLSYANFIGPWGRQVFVAHSIYFQVLGQHGFVGLGLYVALLFSAIMSLWRLSLRAKKRDETYWIAEYAWALYVGVIAFAVAGAFLNLAYFTLLYAFIAAAIVLRREYERYEERIAADKAS